MANKLTEIMAKYGLVGKAMAVTRKQAANLLGASVREVQSLAEQSRNDGDPAAIVCYTSAGKKKGLYLASGSEEISELKEKVTREAKVRLRQRRGLQRALLAVQPNTVFPKPPDNLVQGDIFPAAAPATRAS